MNHIVYQHSPISSIKGLSGLLQIPEDVIIDVASKSNSYYYQNKPEIKPDGRERITYRIVPATMLEH